MRNFSKKLAFVLAAAMVFTAFAPAAKADAAEKEMAMNRASQTLYVNEDGVNQKGAETLPEGLYGNVQEYDFYVKNKPANYAKEYDFKWESSKPEVATVDNKGLTKAVAVGTTTITCTITDKAAKVDPVVVEAKVTVKANAAAVVITNADEYEDFVVADERVIDLNRKMYAEGDKEGTSKRGVKVTDYTKWVAKFDGEVVDATVVAIDQATGKFTFAADAPAGEYELSCYTYQSDKYNQATATSDPVVVTVEDAKNTFVTDQKSISDFTIAFDRAVTALGKADVTVEKVKVRNGKDYFTKMPVKSVSLSKDGLTADVTLFGSMEDANNYKVTVANFDESDVLTASVGYPTYIIVTAQVNNADVDPLTTNVPATLVCKFFDENDVDVSAKGYKATYSLVEHSKNGGYTLNVADGKLTIKKAGEIVGVKAKCQKYENGKLVVDITDTFTFTAKDADPIYAIGVADFSVNDKYDGNKAQTVQVQDKTGKVLSVKVVTDDGKEQKTAYKAGDELPTAIAPNTKQKLSFTALNPDICNITSTGMLIPYKADVAGFYVNTVTEQKNGTKLVEPFAEIYIEVKANSKFDEFKLDKYDVSVGVVDDYDTATIKATSYDQYDNKIDGKKLEISGVSENAKKLLEVDKTAVAGPDAGGKEQAISVDGSKILTALTGTDFELGAGGTAYLEFKVKIDNYEQFFSVTVQNKSDDVNDNYVAVENDNKTEALRVVSDKDETKAAKKLTFSVYQMNNGIKVDTQTFKAYPDKLDNVSTGDFYYKVTKDGNAVDKAYINVGSDATLLTKVVIDLSGLTDAVSGSAIGTGKTVNYNKTGAGTYTFELYRSFADKSLDLVETNTVTVGLGEKGAYSIETQKENTVTISEGNDHSIANGYSQADKLAIVKCFKIKDRQGNEIDFSKDDYNNNSKKVYDVKYDAVKGTGTVYVESITIYEALGNNEFVAYEIPVNVVLERK